MHCHLAVKIRHFQIDLPLRVHCHLVGKITLFLFFILAFCGPAFCLTIVSFIGCDRYWTLAMLTLAITLLGASYSGILINHLDLAPNFAGTLYGLVAGLACISSWLAPLVVATLTEAEVRILILLFHSPQH